jgi:hypothetical protein
LALQETFKSIAKGDNIDKSIFKDHLKPLPEELSNRIFEAIVRNNGDQMHMAEYIYGTAM